MNQKKTNEFRHHDAAHCESGAVSSLLTNYGMQLSEPMVFGLSSAIIFFYFPFVKVWGHPLISYRMPPKSMIKKMEKILGIKFVTKTYDDQQKAMDELDELLDNNQPVGMQASVGFLTYIIPEFRVYFNSHILLIYGRDGDEYLVSDTVVDRPMRIKKEDLRKARFAKGQDAPKGFIFYPVSFPESIDYKKAIEKSVKTTVKMMLQPLLPFPGIKGIKSMAKLIDKLNRQSDKKHSKSFLNNMLMFQEEMGTGGGGFRYLYAAFLKESFEKLGIKELELASKKMVETADLMRKLAAECARIIKNKNLDFDLSETANLVRAWAESEKEVYLILKKINWK